ncbi:hypothetical protein O3M35_007211 [Rhynocoris fuscipes]|uniref:Replication protein A 14 kDa subunit n=1 Tax=Rhynocoris fuscipes TaxID=488301 RepID=A0AAW1DA60_9HEMI
MTADESSFRVLVNGSLLPQFVGKVVTIFGTVNGTPRGSMFDIITTDKHLVSITLRKPLSEPIAGLVEVHGIVKNKDSIICNYYMMFPPDIASTYGKFIY